MKAIINLEYSKYLSIFFIVLTCNYLSCTNAEYTRGEDENQPTPNNKPNQPTPNNKPKQITPNNKPNQPTPNNNPNQPTPNNNPNQPTPNNNPNQPTPNNNPNQPTPNDNPKQITPNDNPKQTNPNDNPKQTTNNNQLNNENNNIKNVQARLADAENRKGFDEVLQFAKNECGLTNDQIIQLFKSHLLNMLNTKNTTKYRQRFLDSVDCLKYGLKLFNDDITIMQLTIMQLGKECLLDRVRQDNGYDFYRNTVLDSLKDLQNLGLNDDNMIQLCEIYLLDYAYTKSDLLSIEEILIYATHKLKLNPRYIAELCNKYLLNDAENEKDKIKTGSVLTFVGEKLNPDTLFYLRHKLGLDDTI